MRASLINPYMFGGITFEELAFNVAGGSNSLSWGSVNIGTAQADRMIIACVADYGYSAVNSVTVNGVSLTKRTSSSNETTIWSALVTSGTSVTVSMGLSGSGSRNAGIKLYAVYGITNATADFNNQAAGGSTTISYGNSSFVVGCGRSGSTGVMGGAVTHRGAESLSIGGAYLIFGESLQPTSAVSQSITCSGAARTAAASWNN